jgi:secretion/DNA translocation related TadE-like protein
VIGLRRATLRDDTGSASVWVIAFALLTTTLTLTALARGAAVGARHELERSADLSALAAAQQIGRGKDPCVAAGVIAQANHARLSSCLLTMDLSERSGTVQVVLEGTVTLPLVGIQGLHAHARAARLPAGSPG